MLKSGYMSAILFVIGLAGCQTTTTGTPTSSPDPAASEEGTLSIRRFELPQTATTSAPYRAALVMNSVTPEGAFVNVQKACFVWNTDGPYCFEPNEIDNSQGIVSTLLTTGSPGTWTLRGYLQYRTSGGSVRNTNALERTITIQ